eukprot:TRINITY_DN3600_c0_g1_i1.p1 TRINITY_DN3600_c0_g1~~TRINITY_DN3600_c0_g1_i1.p1  ORF type:complete len:248 (+),score=55.60 TRINITY_DN3600_c0_g1_i1:122-865(+)
MRPAMLAILSLTTVAFTFYPDNSATDSSALIEDISNKFAPSTVTACTRNLALLPRKGGVIGKTAASYKDLLKLCLTFSPKSTSPHNEAGYKAADVSSLGGELVARISVEGMKSFVSGLHRGIRETKVPHTLMTCITEDRAIVSQLKKAVELICTTTVANIKTGCELLVSGCKGMFKMLESCLPGYNILLKLQKEINSADPKKMQKLMIESLGRYYTMALEAAKAFGFGNYEHAGFEIGQTLKGLFLS